MKFWGRGAGLSAYSAVIILSTRGVPADGSDEREREREHNSSGPGEITRAMTNINNATINIDDIWIEYASSGLQHRMQEGGIGRNGINAMPTIAPIRTA